MTAGTSHVGETSGTTSAAPTSTAPIPGPATDGGAPCGEEAAEPVAVRIPDGAEFEAALMGEGDVGIVFGHQFSGDWCSWLPVGKRVANRGARVLLVQFREPALTKIYMEAAAAELRRLGSSRIALVGASMGAVGALAAAPNVDGLAGIAAFSTPVEFEGVSAFPAVESIDVPLVFIAAKGDGDIPREAERLFAAAPSESKKLILTQGLEHGTELLANRQVRRALDAFLKAVIQPR